MIIKNESQVWNNMSQLCEAAGLHLVQVSKTFTGYQVLEFHGEVDKFKEEWYVLKAVETNSRFHKLEVHVVENEVVGVFEGFTQLA